LVEREADILGQELRDAGVRMEPLRGLNKTHQQVQVRNNQTGKQASNFEPRVAVKKAAYTN